MKSIIMGTIVETAYHVSFDRNLTGELLKKPLLQKRERIVERVPVPGIAPINGEISANAKRYKNSFTHCINLSETEEVTVEGQVYRADKDELHIITDKVVENREVNRQPAEEDFQKLLHEYNRQCIEADSRLKRYCDLHNLSYEETDPEQIAVYVANECGSLCMNTGASEAFDRLTDHIGRTKGYNR